MVIVCDHGCYTLKIENHESDGPKIIQNALIKSKFDRRGSFIGNQYENVINKTSMQYVYPSQRGYIINWELQKLIWNYIFENGEYDFSLKEHPMIITEPIANFKSITECFSEILFEDFELKSLYLTTSPHLSYMNYRSLGDGSSRDSCIIVDSGFSFTHIVPIINGKIFTDALIRIDVGGKHLTNYLKDIISFRQINILDEPYIATHIKEDVCFTSHDFKNNLSSSDSTNRRILYQLPDFQKKKRGFITPDQPRDNTESQLLELSNERITIPEVLFHPSIIGVKQIGISDAISHSISLTPREFHANLYSNIVLTGGSTCFPYFKERLYKDIREEAPSFYNVDVFQPTDPISFSWFGGSIMAQELPEDQYMTKDLYFEHGPCRVSSLFKKINYS